MEWFNQDDASEDSIHRISIQQEGKRGGGRLFFPQIEPN